MKKITKKIVINAPKEKVWNVLVEDELNRLWLSEFSKGSHAITDWIEGHKIVFSDDSNRGIVGKIEQKHPYEMISIVYEGFHADGKEDYESAEALKFKDTHEKYFLFEADGVTTLLVELDMPEEYHDMMSKAWDKALPKIEMLSLM